MKKPIVKKKTSLAKELPNENSPRPKKEDETKILKKGESQVSFKKGDDSPLDTKKETDTLSIKKEESEFQKEANLQNPVGFTQSYREMDLKALNRQQKEMKEKMLDYVNEIILRQDARDPVSKIESFVNETAARRVLKDLIEEFKLECKKIADKSKIHDD